jgi:predicted RNA-binding Zn-ribbon protein involved in translation (DUF1610 family)
VKEPSSQDILRCRRKKMKCPSCLLEGKETEMDSRPLVDHPGKIINICPVNPQHLEISKRKQFSKWQSFKIGFLDACPECASSTKQRRTGWDAYITFYRCEHCGYKYSKYNF